MSFIKKIWKDRVVDAPSRRKLKDTSTGVEQIVDVSRAEGNVVVEGDKFNANSMNDLEQRIVDSITAIDTNVDGLTQRMGSAEADIDEIDFYINGDLVTQLVNLSLRITDVEENGGGGGTPTNLAEVAYSGDYNDLTNIPDIRNDGEKPLTIEVRAANPESPVVGQIWIISV